MRTYIHRYTCQELTVEGSAKSQRAAPQYQPGPSKARSVASQATTETPAEHLHNSCSPAPQLETHQTCKYLRTGATRRTLTWDPCHGAVQPQAQSHQGGATRAVHFWASPIAYLGQLPGQRHLHAARWGCVPRQQRLHAALLAPHLDAGHVQSQGRTAVHTPLQRLHPHAICSLPALATLVAPPGMAGSILNIKIGDEEDGTGQIRIQRFGTCSSSTEGVGPIAAPHAGT